MSKQDIIPIVPTFKGSDFLFASPFLLLVLTGLLLVMAEAFAKGENKRFLMKLSVAGGVTSALAAVFLYRHLGEVQSVSLFSGMLVADRMAAVMSALFSLTAAAVAMISAPHQEAHDWQEGEYYGLLMLSTSGMVILAMAGNLVAVFLGVETMSIAIYALVCSRRGSRKGAEGAIKYFLMGAFATGFLLYGIALVYGATGALDLATIASVAQADAGNPVLVVGILMLVIAFGFKVAAVPFHMWAPDAYEAAPTPVTGFMAAAVKSAAFVTMVRLFGDTFGGDILPFGKMGWSGSFAVIAAITMTVGNVAALRQNSVKRMLAFSSVSHAGVLLVGLVAMGVGAGYEARTAVLYYLIAYSVTTIGAFAVATWIGDKDGERTQVDDWAGLATSHPGAALVMTICLLSLAGMPPTGGFLGKFLIFKAGMQAYDQQLWWLVLIGVLNSVVSIYYYLRLVMTMYFREPIGEFKPLRSAGIHFVMVAAAILILQMGLMPKMWLAFAAN